MSDTIGTPAYANFSTVAKFEAIKSIIAKRLVQHPNAICSYSGGSDSDIVVHLIESQRKMLELPPVKYVFFDTGLEMQATKRHVEEVQKLYGIKIETVKPKKNIVTSCHEYGIPFVSKLMSEGLSRLQRKNIPISIYDEYQNAEDMVAKRRELSERYPNSDSAINFLCCCKTSGEPKKVSELVMDSSKYMVDFLKENPVPFKVSNKCCTYCKKSPAYEAQKNYDMVITGERRAEGGARAIPNKGGRGEVGCFTETADGKFRLRPLFYVTDTDKAWYKEYYGLRYSDAYEVYGLKRTGCCGCSIPAKAAEDLEKIRLFEPKLVKAAWAVFGESYMFRDKYNEYKAERKRQEREAKMNKSLTLGSLFDGSGGFPLGGLHCGIKPLWASEVEPFPIRVTTKRLPQMKHLSDINKLNGATIPPVDIITGGFCCQDLSVAGKRAGLHGERSGLFFQVIRTIREMRAATNNEYPKYVVLENVPGLYSSAGGDDFLEVLSEIIRIKDETLSISKPEKGWSTAGEIVGDGFSVGWRTLDAQFWGVAQRRRRCYIVVDFTGERAGQILFDESRLSRDSQAGGVARQETAGGIEACSGSTSKPVAFEPGAASRLKGRYTYQDICGTLRADMGDNQAAVAIPLDNHPADSRVKFSEDGVVQTLSERMGTGGGNVPLVMNERQYALTIGEEVANTLTGTDYKGTQCVFEPKAYGICSVNSNSMKSGNPHSGIYEAETSRTLDLNGGSPVCNQGGMAVVAIEGNGQRASHKGSGVSEDGVSYTINTIERHAVCYQDKIGSLCASDYKFPQQQQIEEGKAVVEREVCGNTGFGKYTDKVSPLKASGGDYPGGENVVVENRYVVRRLTPQECALLQGFPLNWCSGLETPEPTEEDITFWENVWETDRLIKGTSSKPKSRKQIIKWLKDPHSDSAEYKMWGNGVALPCVEFVLSGIVHNELNNRNRLV